jgi:hypothetical protein
MGLEMLRGVYPERSEGLSMTRPVVVAVTLSEAKGLSRWAARCFAALSMTSPIFTHTGKTLWYHNI